MESQTTEWKSIWKSEYLKTIAAFFNTDGGVFIIGKDDCGDIIGVKDPQTLLKQLPDTMRNKLGIMPSVEAATEDNKTFITISVEKGNRLVDLDGVYYKRVGSTTQRVTGEALQSWLLSRLNKSWTELPSTDKLDSVSDEAIKHFIDAGKNAERIPPEMDRNTLNILERFDLINLDGCLIRAASLMFGKKSSNAYDGTFVKIGEFSEDGELRREDRIFVPVIMQPDAVMDALYEKYIPGLFEYEGAKRIIAFRYPKEAVREALINALIHKRYEAFEPVTIKVYPNSLTIFNPGTLPEGWTAENLKKPHRSIRRNKLMAEIFHEAGYVETWGKGINLIHTSCKKNGNPEPNFDISTDGLGITFIPNRFIKYDLQKGLPEGLTDAEIKVCEMISDNSRVTIDKMSKELGLSSYKTRSILELLVEKGLIKRLGSKKSGFWIFTGVV